MAEPGKSERPPAERRRTAPDDGASPLGERLRAERDRLGLSLRELARRLEVSPSLVSQIETGKIQPSVRTLYAIVSELGVSLDELFSDGASGLDGGEPPAATPSLHALGPRAAEAPVQAQGRVQPAAARRVIELESGVRWELLTTSNDPDVDFLHAIYEVGGASSSDGKLVRHNGREFGIVLSGRLGVTVGFEEHVLGPGDSISFESTIPHRLHNDGPEVVHAIWVVLGRYH